MAGRIETYEDLCAKARHEIPYKEAHTNGYAAGIEAAAKCAQQHGSTPGRELAETIRALGKEGP